MNAIPEINSEATILPESVEEMARGIVMNAKSIRSWLDQPEVKARYEKWLAERRQRGTEAV